MYQCVSDLYTSGQVMSTGSISKKGEKKTFSTAKVWSSHFSFFLITGAVLSYKYVNMRMNPSWFGILNTKSITT
jgi:hypothetical protein